MTKKKTLVNENVIRRWGKLANMPSLTENYLDTIEEQEEEDLGAEEMEAGAEEPSPEEMEAVESIVSAVVDAISNETGVEIEVEGGAEEGEADEEGGDAEGEEMEMGAEEEAPAEEEPPANRGMPYNRKDEELNIDVLDDEALTEAVLHRVVERLLKRK